MKAAAMKAIDRIMRAYLSTRNLTDDEVSRVKAELVKFIDELMIGAARARENAELGQTGGLSMARHDEMPPIPAANRSSKGIGDKSEAATGIS